MIPYFIGGSFGTVYCFAVGAVGLISSAEELLIHILCREYTPGVMSLFDLRKKRASQTAPEKTE